jgi:hypothetical protein
MLIWKLLVVAITILCSHTDTWWYHIDNSFVHAENNVALVSDVNISPHEEHFTFLSSYIINVIVRLCKNMLFIDIVIGVCMRIFTLLQERKKFHLYDQYWSETKDFGYGISGIIEEEICKCFA